MNSRTSYDDKVGRAFWVACYYSKAVNILLDGGAGSVLVSNDRIVHGEVPNMIAEIVGMQVSLDGDFVISHLSFKSFSRRRIELEQNLKAKFEGESSVLNYLFQTPESQSDTFRSPSFICAVRK